MKNNMALIDEETIRKEIEFAKSVYSNPKRVVHGVADAFRQDGRAAMCDDILKKLDILPEQEHPIYELNQILLDWVREAKTDKEHEARFEAHKRFFELYDEYMEQGPEQPAEIRLDNHTIMEEIRKCGCNPNEFDVARHFFELGLNARKED